MKLQSNTNVQSVERALDILDCFTVDEPDLSIAEISEKLLLPKSTVFRLLGTLKNKNYIEQDTFTQKYRLGFRVYGLGNIYAADMDLRRLALPIMKELNLKTSETINLNVVDRGQRVCIEKIESPHLIRNFVKVGERNSLCFGAAGKVLLAFLPEVEAFYLISKENFDLEEKKALLEDLQKIRQDGYFISAGNRIEGALAISAPIFDVTGTVIAGLSISGPIERLSARTEELTLDILHTTAVISAKMGYSIKTAKLHV